MNFSKLVGDLQRSGINPGHGLNHLDCCNVCRNPAHQFEKNHCLESLVKLQDVFSKPSTAGQIIATKPPRSPQKVAKEGKSPDFRKIQVGEIL